MSDPTSEPVSEPLLRIVKGDPTDEELAALVAVVSAVGASGADAGPRKPRPQWSAPHRLVRSPLAPSWRASALPR